MEAESIDSPPPKRKRRWYQFSLRTLLIVVTLLAVPCGFVRWKYSVVWQREEMIRRITTVDRGYVWWAEGVPTPPKEQGISWIRRLLGDAPVSLIVLPMNTAADERATIRAVFPGVQLMAFVSEDRTKAIPFPEDRASDFPNADL